METLIEDFLKVSNALAREDAASIFYHLQMSIRTNPSDGIVDVHLLNVRYAFSKKGKVPQTVENWIEKVKQLRPSIKEWNELLKILAVVAEG